MKYHIKEFSLTGNCAGTIRRHKPKFAVCTKVGKSSLVVRDNQGAQLIYPTKEKALACRDYLNRVGTKGAKTKRKPSK